MPLALRREVCVPKTATVSPTGNSYINGVLASVRWASDALTFSSPSSRGLYGKHYGAVADGAQPIDPFSPGCCEMHPILVLRH